MTCGGVFALSPDEENGRDRDEAAVTTRRQIRELAAPLLARHADLALVKNTIAIRPVNHLLSFISDRAHRKCGCI